MPSVSIVAAYRFVDLPDAAALRDKLFDSAQAAGLKGTLLLAEEGINLSLSGADAALRGWMHALQADARFAGLDAKWHRAAAMPFRMPWFTCSGTSTQAPPPPPGLGRARAAACSTVSRWRRPLSCSTGGAGRGAGAPIRPRSR